MANYPNTRPTQPTPDGPGWGTACVLIALTAIILSGLILAFGGKADAAPPYGGCKEAQTILDVPPSEVTAALHSDGARYCRQHGWIIRRHLTVDPYGFAVTTLPRCKEEGESAVSCYWDAKRQGNGRGHGFIALPGRTVYVDSINGRWVTPKKNRLGYWNIVPYNY